MLAGEWVVDGCIETSPLNDLAGDGALADLTLESAGEIELNLSHKEQVLVYVHTGAFASPSLQTGQLAIVDPQQLLQITAAEQGAGALILTGNKINEKIVHMGPFVMNTEQEIQQAISDYQQGKFGRIS